MKARRTLACLTILLLSSLYNVVTNVALCAKIMQIGPGNSFTQSVTDYADFNNNNNTKDLLLVSGANNIINNTEELLLSVPFYIYNEFDWLSDDSNTTIGNLTFADYANRSFLGGKKQAEDVEILFYLSAIKHPMRVSRPEDAKLFLLPMLSTNIGWSVTYGSKGTRYVCNRGLCDAELVRRANEVLGNSEWFQRSNGKDHITTMTSMFWGNVNKNRFTTYQNFRRCNAILPEQGKELGIIDSDRVSFNMMYVASGCPTIIPFKNKTHDFTMVGTLEKYGKRRRSKLNQRFQDRRDLCDWVQSENFTSKHSMSICGRGDQCPALSYSRLGFHVRGDSFSASRLFHTLLSGTVPIFTLDQQYYSHQSFIDWRKLSYFIKMGAFEGEQGNQTSFLHQLDEILLNKEDIEEKTKLVLDNRDIFDWFTIHPFDIYMYMFQSHIYPDTRVGHSKYSALILPPVSPQK